MSLQAVDTKVALSQLEVNILKRSKSIKRWRCNKTFKTFRFRNLTKVTSNTSTPKTKRLRTVHKKKETGLRALRILSTLIGKFRAWFRSFHKGIRTLRLPIWLLRAVRLANNRRKAPICLSSQHT